MFKNYYYVKMNLPNITQIIYNAYRIRVKKKIFLEKDVWFGLFDVSRTQEWEPTVEKNSLFKISKKVLHRKEF
jgi:hypothetical protein